jgi:hypothetical protein
VSCHRTMSGFETRGSRYHHRAFCVKTRLARDAGCDEIQPRHLPRFARRHTGFRAGRAPTTRDAGHSEGNDQSYIEDLKRRKGADADQPHRIAYKKPVRAVRTVGHLVIPGRIAPSGGRRGHAGEAAKPGVGDTDSGLRRITVHPRRTPACGLASTTAARCTADDHAERHPRTVVSLRDARYSPSGRDAASQRTPPPGGSSLASRSRRRLRAGRRRHRITLAGVTS